MRISYPEVPEELRIWGRSE